MKELSTEEKAQAYDEALERAKILYNDKNEIGYANAESVLEEVFPLLKESEDERIRKWIIDDIRYNMDNEPLNNSEYKKKAEKAIAWLEKHGEQKLPIEKLPSEMITPEESLGISSEKYNDIVNECLYGESKAEWKQENVEELSEFENAMMHIGYSFFGKRGGLDPNDTSSVKVQAQYLLELAQKSAEWSEEDEHRVKDTIYFLETAKKHYASTVELGACIDWLKSLKQRCTWKPSDEQVKQLGWIAEQNKDNMIGKELISLYQDLKKLRKE